jgi:hypothetical protein
MDPEGTPQASPIGVGPARSLPPPDFPVYALVRPSDRPSLDFLEVSRPGGAFLPPVGVWLAHRSAGIRIGSFSTNHIGDDEPLRRIALRVAEIVSDLALPGPADTPPAGLDLPRLVEVQAVHCASVASNLSAWTETTFVVAGVPCLAWQWHFAGVWGAFTAAVGDVYILAVGVGAAPTRLEVEQVRVGQAVGFDPGRPLTRFFARGQTRDWYETMLRKPNVHSCHQDQLALLVR